MKILLYNSLENRNFQSYNLYVNNLKEHLCNNVEMHLYQTSLSVDAGWHYHTKVYNINSSILVWLLQKPYGQTWWMSSFLLCINPQNIYFELISFRIICFTLNSSNNEKILESKPNKRRNQRWGVLLEC